MQDEEFFDNEDSFKFFQLVHMFQRSVLFNLGLLPVEEEEIYDMAEAKEGIETGKTTTAAKLGKRLTDSGYHVVAAAADTFRAGAIEQLETHMDRLGIRCISSQRGGGRGCDCQRCHRACESEEGRHRPYRYCRPHAE